MSSHSQVYEGTYLDEGLVLAAGLFHGQAQGLAHAPACARAADRLFFADGEHG
jgi:hypothetical protein